jgi:uncharacterized protein
MAQTDEKLRDCTRILSSYSSLAIAFSGGVDSTLLLCLAAETLGPDRVLALTSIGAFTSRAEHARAERLAGQLGVQHVLIEIDILAEGSIAANDPRRCYHCKKALFSRFLDEARRRGLDIVASGDNADDAGDYRPGLQAERELGIARPLAEAGLTKAEIREISRRRDLPTWDLPSAACLASRIPYGQAITESMLEQVQRGEEILHELGYHNCRLRHHGSVARIEVPADRVDELAADRGKITARIKALGFAYVTCDLEGLRSGSMNEVLGPDRAD